MSDLPTLALDQALLGLLMQHEMHGYALYASFCRELGPLWKAGRSQVYALLHELEARGAVRATWATEGHRPPRQVYQLTEAGRETFLAWVHAPVAQVRDMRVEFLAKLALFRLLALPGVEQLLDRQEAILRERLNQVEAQKIGSASAALSLSFRRAQLEALLGWLQSVRDEPFLRSAP